ncbi:N-acetyltransferase [Pseudonocardiaceae bacterium YIM PH 21723]|nr:N-acetyltransferase [Pseudonocardiaceae bacterium YIM PH 21723]
MEATDADAVLDIYAHGIRSGLATFETEVPGWAAFDATRLPGHRWVLEQEGAVRGWIACSPVSSRCVYSGVVEHSVYVHPLARRTGAGRALLDRLITSTEQAGIWTIQAGMFPDNTGSIALHEAVGFRVVGTRERLGRRDGQWRDVLLMERRSPNV